MACTMTGAPNCLRELERLDERRQIVAVDGAEVLDVEVRVERRVVREAGEEAVRAAAHAAVDRARGRAELAEHLVGAAVQLAVGVARCGRG